MSGETNRTAPGEKGRHYYFAGGGTGGHIYPALAVAEKIRERDPSALITFFCSSRAIDAQILSKYEFEFIPLPAVGFSFRPDRCLRFGALFIKSYYFVRQILQMSVTKGIIIGVGGFVSAPAILAAHRLKIPIALVNVDILPGRANKLFASMASKIFVQFADTVEEFVGKKDKVMITGCPLRSGFSRPDREAAIRELELDPDKKTLLITGASSGAKNINRAFGLILPRLGEFADRWQVVHLTGTANFEQAKADSFETEISYKLIDYYEQMPDLYAAADLIVGRAGAVSVAEYAAAGVPSICIPYPYHEDRHQYLNAGKLVEAGAAVISEDMKDDWQKTAGELFENLGELMADDAKREEMAKAAKKTGRLDSAEKIAVLLSGL